ncbi:unnamed protein product, partial [Choristocarpus tenellus]
ASELHCKVCKECKSEALSYARGGHSPKTVGEVVHTDMQEPFNPDVTGMKYFQVFVDEASREKRVIGLRTKDAATAATAAYIDEMARDGVVVRCISGDGAGEFGRSIKFQRMLTERGVKWRKSPPHIPQSNGIAERAIKQIMQAARSQLIQAGMGEEFWFFAVADATFKTTGMPHEYLGGETPYERLTNTPFNYKRLRVFGTECFVHRTKQQRGANAKFHPYAKRGILEGKLVTSAQVSLQPEDKLLELVREPELDTLGEPEFHDDMNMDMRDEEEASATGSETRGESQNIGRRAQDTKRSASPQSQEISTRMGQRQRMGRAAQMAAKRLTPHSGLRRSARLEQRQRVTYTSKLCDQEEEEETAINHFVSTLMQQNNKEVYCFMGLMGEVTADPDEPSTTKATLSGPDGEQWQEAMEKEMAGLWQKGTFSDKDLPQGRKAIKTRFVFKIKRSADGSVEPYKARLVARGFTQNAGVDFFETFSPVVGYDTLRCIISVAAYRGWSINALDFTQAY